MTTNLIMQSQDPVTEAWLRRIELGERPAWGLILENVWVETPDNLVGLFYSHLVTDLRR